MSKEFVACLKDIKASLESTLPDTRKMVTDAFDEMLNSVSAGSEKSLSDVTPEDILGAIRTTAEANLDYMSAEQIDALMSAFAPAFAPIPKEEPSQND